MHEAMPRTVDEMQVKGLKCLMASALKNNISGRCYVGLYRAPFRYVMRFSDDGKLWGQNNFGTQDVGKWSIDATENTLTVSWENGWDANTTTGYIDDGEIHLFDAETGLWRTTLLHEIGESELTSQGVMGF